MASSSSNITAVHFSLIIFVMLFIIASVVSYMYIDEAGRLRKDAADKDAELRKVKQERDTYADSLTAVKAAAGYPQTEVGLDSNAKDAALAMMKADIKKYGEGINLRYAQKIITLRSTLINKQRQAADLQQAMNDAQQKFREALAKADKLKKALEIERDGFKKQYEQQLAEVRKVEKAKEEAIKAKDEDISRLETARQQLQTQLDTAIAQHKEAMEKLQKDLDNAKDTIALKQKIIDNLLNVSFERPDGEIVSVDRRTGLVWIDLGTEDRLPDRMTFSVYSQQNHGIARDSDRYKKLANLMEVDAQNPASRKKVAGMASRSEDTRHDIKGSIEVTRIIQPHLAEAHILKDDPYHPIRAGDPIYTPLWSPGVQESFAFAGVMDLDGDGKDDSSLLHRIVRAAGAKIVAYTNDKGQIEGSPITNEVKFLVVGDVPDPQKVPPASPESQIRKARSTSMATMRKQADQSGVRIVRLTDFLSYLGYKPDRRLWRPGEQVRRKLKAGAHSTAVNETLGNRSSTGSTSGRFSKSGRTQYGAATGSTSKRFSGTYGR